MNERTDKNLAEGEVTGHAHVAMAATAQVYGDGPDRLLTAPDGTEVTHEEHRTIALPPGEYDVGRQMEIDPDTDEVRALLD